jgi:hypothetical protein
MSEAQKAAVREILSSISAIANVNVVEVPSTSTGEGKRDEGVR